MRRGQQGVCERDGRRFRWIPADAGLRRERGHHPPRRGECSEIKRGSSPRNGGPFLQFTHPFSSVLGSVNGRNGVPTRGLRTFSCRTRPLSSVQGCLHGRNGVPTRVLGTFSCRTGPLFLGTGVFAWKKWSANPGKADLFLQKRTPFPRYRGVCMEKRDPIPKRRAENSGFIEPSKVTGDECVVKMQ